MDPDAVKSTLSNLAFGNVMAAAARDYQKVTSLTHSRNWLWRLVSEPGVLLDGSRHQRGGIESRFLIGSGVDGRLIRPRSTRLSCAAGLQPWIVEGRGNGEDDLVILLIFFLDLQQQNVVFASKCRGSFATGMDCGRYNHRSTWRMILEIVAKEKAQAANASHDEVDLDELLDDPELEKLHAERIAALKKEVEKREVLKRQGHGEYREITEGDFLGEVTGSEKVICHFYHREFYRCKIMDKHLKTLAPVYLGTKFIKLDAENAPFFVTKLGIKTLPCVILFKKGIAVDRLVGFQDLGSKDDFSTRALENILKMKGIIDEKKKDEDDEDDETDMSMNRRIRSSTAQDSDSE
uniref:tRNA synthetase, putative, expressed n=2 Tax=Oryza sativa subsp. japonica TaxID=39947 RepID=Q2R1H7_ORYSJ|nr:TRNA synthetase, putative, expressed [Oryza sativa Japonica Group]